MFFNDDGTGQAKLRSRDGRAEYTGRHLPTGRGWFGRRVWPGVVVHNGRTFVDTRQFDGEFRLYDEVVVESFA